MRYPVNFPFHRWVPRPLGTVIFVFMFFPLLCANGVYTNNAGEMTAALGIISEHIQFAYFATAIGMVAFAPFISMFLEIRRTKMVYVGGFSLLFVFTYICAKTGSMYLLFLCSFLMGFLRVILFFNTFIGLLDYVTREDTTAGLFKDNTRDPAGQEKTDRTRILGIPFLFLFLITVTQLGSALTSWLAFTYEWQNVYYCMMGLILIGLLLTLVCMEYRKGKATGRIRFTKFADTVILSLALLSLCFILVYGKTLDWFDSPLIRTARAVFLLSAGVFIFMNIYGKNHYIDLRVAYLRNVQNSFIILFLGMAMTASSALVSVFAGISMKSDTLHSAHLSNYSIIGYIIGAFISFFMGKHRLSFKYIFLIGFLFITTAAIYMYFQFQNQGYYNNLIFPVIVRSAGMIIIYAMGTAYGLVKLPARLFASYICLMLIFRSFAGPAVGTAIYSNIIYDRQQYYVERLSQNADMLNPDAAVPFTHTQTVALRQGASLETAQTVASMQLKGRILIQATLASLKEVAGWTVYAGIACMMIVMVLPYEREKRKRKKKDIKRFDMLFFTYLCAII
jgi:MFS family permease